MHMLLENQIAAFGTLIQDAMEDGFQDLSPRAAAILITLSNRGPLTVSTIAAIAGVSQPTASRIIDGLEKGKTVQRKARDGRQVVVSLTPSGRRAARRLQQSRAETGRRLLKTLGQDDRKTFARLIDRLLFAATENRQFARTACRYCDHGICKGDVCPINRRADEIEAHQSGRSPEKE